MRVSASTPDAAKSTGRMPTACTASVCSGTPYSWAMAASSRIGLTVPTSLFAHITETSATRSGSLGERGAQRLRADAADLVDRRAAPTSAPSCSASHSAESSTAWCSMADTSTRVRRGSAARRAQYRPLTARLSLSVPPVVSTTSDGRAPTAAAIRSRDSSTSRRDRRPAECSDDALPVRPHAAVIAAIAASSIGVVAA